MKSAYAPDSDMCGEVIEIRDDCYVCLLNFDGEHRVPTKMPKDMFHGFDPEPGDYILWCTDGSVKQTDKPPSPPKRTASPELLARIAKLEKEFEEDLQYRQP
jgi:hypothetical protein